MFTVLPAVAYDAEVAVDAFPDNAAVIVPALKFPEESRATTFEAVFEDVASTANVEAAEPLYVVPEDQVKYDPAVNEFKFDPKAIPDIVELANLLFAIEPANIVFVTVPESPVPTNVPVAVGNDKVGVPAVAVA